MTLILDGDGLSVPTQQARVDRLAARLRSTFGPNLRTDAKSIAGQIVNIFCEELSLDDQALLAAYRSMDPDGAAGRQLDARVGLTGTVREGATSSAVEGLLTWSGLGTAPLGHRIRNEANQTIWELTSGAVTPSGPYPEAIAATYTCQQTGPVSAGAGTTWTVVDVVAGLDGFTNPTDDANLGQDRETDAETRRRRKVELFSQGQGPLVAIRSVVSKVDGVLSVRVYHNPTASPADSNGIPFKAFNVVVETDPPTPTPALQQAIAQAIWSALGAGGQAYGTDYTVTIVDSEGVNQQVSFDVVDEVDIVIELDLVTSTSENPITPNLSDIVAAQILAVALAEHEEVGRDVLALDYQGVVHDMLEAGSISGVDAVDVRLAIDPASPAAVAKLAIGARQKADFDSANISVTEV